MATISEERARLQFLESKGRGDEKCHLVLIEVEAAERIKNAGPRPKTKFVLETDQPDLYSKFNELKDRWLKAANKSVALTVWVKLLDRPEEWIREICSGQEDEDFMMGRDITEAE